MSTIRPEPTCREDFTKSVIIDGPIDRALMGAVAPRILELRDQRTPVITVYINSNGGHVGEADAILNLLSFVGLDEYAPWLVTVAFGSAKSAAANMLALGDYAIAYPHASIHFHGVRLADIPNLTMEDASFFADYLVGQNGQTALRLASKAMHRSVLKYILLRPEFTAVRAHLGKPDLHDSECFLHLVSEKLTSDSAKRVVTTALQHFQENKILTDIAITSANAVETETVIDYESMILRSVVAHLTTSKEEKAAGLTDKKLNEVISAYKLLRDYHLGPHTHELKAMVKRFGPSFLTDDEVKHYDALQGSPEEERSEWLEERVWPAIKPFCYLVVAIWQALQEEENPITPNDAYWLGVIDEVAGTDLAALRFAVEQGDE